MIFWVQVNHFRIIRLILDPEIPGIKAVLNIRKVNIAKIWNQSYHKVP